MDQTEIFEAERSRLLGIASRVLGDHAEAEDVVQQAWLRLDRAVTRDGTEIDNLPAWLTTVTTRLCLDRLRARTPGAGGGDRGRRHRARPGRRRRARRHRRHRAPGRDRPAVAARAGGVRAARQLRLRVRHHRRGPRHHARGRPQARLARPVQGRAAGGRGRARGLGGGRRLHGRRPRRRLRAAAPAARARRRRRRRRGGDPGRHPGVDRGPRRGRHLLQRQRPLRARRLRRRPAGVGVVPARRGARRLRLRRRRRSGPRHHLPRRPAVLARVVRRDGADPT